MAGSRELLDSLKPGMHLDKNFFLKVYGHEITRPGFAENVIKRLEILGCSKAREYYTCVVTEFEYKHEQEMKEVAKWYAKQNERGDKDWRRREAEQQRTKSQRLTDKLQLLKRKRELLKRKRELLVREQLAIEVREFKPIESITAAELDALEIQPIDWLVKDILPVGLSILGAPSKYYKSYMALGLCVAICQGTTFLGFDCTKHDCLYFDLESTKRRPKNRLDQILGAGSKKPNNLHIITGEDNPGRIGEGFEAQVEYQMHKYPGIKLIVIDVLQLIR